MSITEISVKRPTAVWMAVVLMLALGVIGYKSMGANFFPAMEMSTISITTRYDGASAEDMKEDIIKPIEDAVSGISGVDTVESRATEGTSTVTINFKSTVNSNTAYLDVQKAVQNASGILPKNADKPSIAKLDTSSMPILILAFSGNDNESEIYNEVDKAKQEIEKVEGVGGVTLIGGNKKQLIIKLDKTAMDYYGVDVNSITQKIEASNLNVPGGRIKQDNMDQTVKVIGQFDNVDKVRNLLIPTSAGGNIRLSDIAKVDLEWPAPESLIKYNNNTSIALMITKQSDANIVTVVNSVKKQLEEIKKNTAEGISIDFASDQTNFITDALTEIKHNLLEGIITTAIVLYLFFRSLRPSMVVLVAIPTSLIATFFLMYEFNFTLNLMSMMGLSLVIGSLVDDSIVVIESIQRHLDMGENLIDAAINGRKEIGLAAIAITLCDVVMFAPIAFMSGTIGQIFKEFGLTIVIATMFSLLVSFTVTPMLSSLVLKRVSKKEKEKKDKAHEKSLFNKVIKLYKKAIIWSLNNRWKVLVASAIGIIFSISLIPIGLIGTEFMATTDESSFSIDIALTNGSTLKQTDDKIVQIESYLHDTKEIKSYISMVGTNSDDGLDKSTAQIYVNLVPKKERKKSQSEIATEVREFGKAIPGIDFSISEADSSGGIVKPIAINIKGNDEETLRVLSDEVEVLLKSTSGITDISNSAKLKNSEVRINVDSLAASNYGLTTFDIGSVIRIALTGDQVGVYRSNNEENDITLKFMEGEIKSLDDIKNIKISNTSGQQIPLSQIASIGKSDTASSISRKARQDIVTVSANVQGRVVGDVNDDINDKLKSLKVPNGYSIDPAGAEEDMGDAGKSLMLALGASVALIYMILVVLYESYLTPAIRMVALPFALMGALLALALTGQTLNVMSGIGIIMLEGLSSKNGTLLIDYTNTLMKKGMNLREALIESGVTRLRPIIMTTATMIVAMIPVSISLGEGSEMKKSMGIVIIGGMILSTLATPIVLPVIYTLMDDLKNFIFKKKKGKEVKEIEQHEL